MHNLDTKAIRLGLDLAQDRLLAWDAIRDRLVAQGYDVGSLPGMIAQLRGAGAQPRLPGRRKVEAPKETPKETPKEAPKETPKKEAPKKAPKKAKAIRAAAPVPGAPVPAPVPAPAPVVAPVVAPAPVVERVNVGLVRVTIGDVTIEIVSK
jgi:hypothetical protein